MLRLTTLGAIDLRDRLGRPVRDVLAQPKRIALLVYLAVEGRRGPVPRDRVLALFWPESDEPRARNALSQALYHLRQAIGPDVIVSTGPSLELAPDQLWCDALVLEDALAAGDAELALDIYNGEFGPALFVTGAAALEEWVSGTRRDQRRRALALLPDDERDVREYLTAIERTGDVAGVLALYAEYVRRIAIDLEAEPAPETEALVQAIRRRRAEAVASATSTSADETGPAPVPQSSLAPTVSTQRTHATRRTLLVSGAVVALSLLLLSARVLMGVAGEYAAGGHAPGAIAVFPFTVRGGDTAAMLGEGQTDLLSAKLQGIDEVRAIDPRSTIAAAEGRTPEPTRADQLSRTLGARYFVLGSLVERAGRLQLDRALYETGRSKIPRAIASVSGDTAEIFTLVDELTGRLLANLLGGRDTALTALASVTTTSLPALKAYLRGERALRAGFDARAAAAFREAALLDTTFALAQYRLSLVANWVIVPGIDDPAVWANAAARHSDRLTPLGRDLLQAYRAYKQPSAEALPLYRAIVKAYPDNVEAWYMLGEAIFHYGPLVGEPLDGAREPFERALRLDADNAHAQLHLARVLARDGDGEAFETLIKRLLAQYGEADRALELRALLAWTRQDSAASVRIVADARGVDEVVAYGLVQTGTTSATNTSIRAFMEITIGQADLGLGHWQRSTVTSGEVNDRARLESEVLAATEPAIGMSAERLRDLRRRIAADRQYAPIGLLGRSLPPLAGIAMRHHLLVLLDLRLGDTLRAQAHADSLAALATGAEAAPARSLVTLTRVEFLRAAGRTAEALAELERFPFDLSDTRFLLLGARERFARAELLLALGRDDEARQWYGTFPAFYDLALLAPARLRLAQLDERAGARERARRGYAQVIALWRVSDN